MAPVSLRVGWLRWLMILILVASAAGSPAQELHVRAREKPRLLVLTDLSNEPDDEQSLVRLLVNSEQFDFEGLVATTSTWLKEGPREDLLRRQLAAYAEVRPRLALHADGFPSVESLRDVTCTGQTTFGMDAVGAGQSSAGSRQILAAADRDDPRPLWVTVWGGANTLAQALFDLRASRSTQEVDQLVGRLRVYAISDQDDAGPWIRREFPGLFYIVSPSNPDWQQYYRATWTGISGDRNFAIGVGHAFEMVDNPWLEKNVIEGHGPLGALYPRLKYIMEGDTPSFLGLIDRGLGWEISPTYGGWGGRYVLYRPIGEPRPIWTDNALNRDTVTADNGRSETSNHATVWRWRRHFQNDFAARMDWCVAETYGDANHNPRPVLNGDRSTGVVEIGARPGMNVELSAHGTDAGDDGQEVALRWWIYGEAGDLHGARLTSDTGDTTVVELSGDRVGDLHVILQVEDDGTPPLAAYRRIVISVRE